MNKLLKFKAFKDHLENVRREIALSEMMRADQELGLYDEIFEGGAYGHILHPFEDAGLTMADIKQMIDTTINGAFGPENFVQEKTDGQQLSISWKNGKLIAARNKTQRKGFGENALDIKGIADMFAGRGDIEIVYNAAMKDLTASIGALSDADKAKYFDEGRKFASLEIITPQTQNTVPYGLNMLVFHGVVEYDEGGDPIGEDKQAGRDLGRLVKEANAEAQETFFVRGPQDMEIKPFPNTIKRASYYNKLYSQLLKEYGLGPASSITEYARKRGVTVLKEEILKAKQTPPSEEHLTQLADRISGISKAFDARQIKKELDPGFASWYVDWEKKNEKQLKRTIYAPLENLFIEVGTEFMKNMSSFLSANPTDAAESMRKEIEKTIAEIKKSGSEEELKKLEHELNRITAAGGLESIVPTEGITFVYKDKLYKFTGIFAPIHQIRSMLAYKK